MRSSCAACTSPDLVPHLRVAGDAGPAGLIPSTDRYGTALADIVRCRACGHMQLERLPDEGRLEEAYAAAESLDYVEEEAGQRASACAALDRIELHAGPGALLDVGSWVGYLLDEARGRGWRAHGLEPSAFASAFARERLGLAVDRAHLFAADLPERAFDAVVLGDVIEHLPRPAAALDRIAGLLAPGGVVYLALPDAGSAVARAMGRRWWSVIPTHVHYFTRASLFTLLRRRGFEPLWAGTAPKAFSVAYYLARAAGYSPRLARAAVAGLARPGSPTGCGRPTSAIGWRWSRR